MKRLAPALLALLAVGAIAVAMVLQRLNPAPKAVAPAGPFTLAQLHGEIGLVNVWATWCPPCRREIPTLLQIADEYEPRGVHFVAVNADEDDHSVVEAFLKNEPPSLKKHLAFPRDGFLDSIGLQGLPTTLIVDKQGNVVKRFVGEIRPDEVKAALDQALAASAAKH